MTHAPIRRPHREADPKAGAQVGRMPRKETMSLATTQVQGA